MDKSPDAFRTISEVADWLGVQAHVLRFWESKFTHVKPVKRAGGRRYYRPADMMLLGGIKKLLHEDGMTIKGVQKILREQGVPHVAEMSQSLDDMAVDGSKPRRAQTVLQSQTASAATTAQPAAPSDKQIELALETFRSETDISKAAVRSAAPRPETDPLIEDPAPRMTATEDAPEVSFEPEPKTVPEKEAPSEPAPAASPPAPMDHAPTAPETAAVGPEPEPEVAEPEDEPAPAPVPTFRRHTTPRPAPAPEPAAPMETVSDEQPEIESEPVEASASTAEPAAHDAPVDPAETEPEAELEAEEAPTDARPRIVDAPDPAADDEIEAQVGLLGQLAPVESLSPDQIATLLPLVQELEAWYSAQLPKHAT